MTHLPRNPETTSAETLPQMVLANRGLYEGRPVLKEKRAGRYRDIDWQKFESRLQQFSCGLIALGVTPGDRVAIMAPNGPNWAWADLAIQSCGGATVPVYHTEGLTSTIYILEDSGSHYLFAWSPVVVEDLIKHLDELPHLRKIILLHGRIDHEQVISLGDFITAGESQPTELLTSRLETGQADDLASIVYTSGTTGPPKGVMLTHDNFLSNVRDCDPLFDLGPKDTCLSFLPLSHVFERMAGYYLMLHQGTTIAYAENIDSVPNNMLEVKPTVMISVPRLYEKMFARVMERVLSGSWFKRRIFFGALNLCKRRIALEQAKQEPPGWLNSVTQLARDKIFIKLREPLGGRLRFFVSGGAPLVPQVAEFFHAAGIPIYEGYGLTETSPVIGVNTPEHTRIGTIGKTLPRTEVRIADDGEILVRGPGIFLGYWEKPEQTRDALEGGWFHTGDIGTLDADGFLAITDRKKDLIVTSSGENIAPQSLEKHLKTDKFIANAMVHGDRRPFLTALLVPNFDNLHRYAQMKKIDFLTPCDLVNHPQILDLIRRRVESLQEGKPGFQQIRRFTLLSRDFSGEAGEITPTLKIRRKVITQKFRQIIEGMYQAKDHGIHDAGFCIIDENDDS